MVEPAAAAAPSAARIPVMRTQTEKRLLALIVALFVLLGVVYAIVTPVFEASDELWHYPMVRHLADGNPLPVQVFDPAEAGPWNQEASQPPLYYYLAAGLTFWIDTADMEQIRWLNPHVDNGVITPDGNNNLVVHDPAADPWQGTLLAVRLIRLVSVLLGACTVVLTFAIGKETVPGRPEIALGAAAINAFLPMFVFISGAVNNDNLALPLTSLALFLMIHFIVRARDAYRDVRPWEWLGLGSILGLAALTKEGTLGLFPLALGTAIVAAWQGVESRASSSAGTQDRAWAAGFGHLVWSLVLVFAPALLIAGWWYYRNIVLYGDWLGWNAFIAVLGQRAHPASLLQLWGERHGFMQAFWGLFGGVNIPMASWIYTVFNTVLVISVIGFAIYAARLLASEVRAWRSSDSDRLTRLLRATERNFGLIVCLLFSAAVVYGLIQWATTTWSSQGRLVFTAISALAVLMATGLAAWLPSRAARWTMGGVAAFMFVVTLAAPFVWIRPAYQPPQSAGQLTNRLGETFGDSLRLAGYEIVEAPSRPGDPVHVRLEWQALKDMERNWSVFVHVSDPVLGQPIAQRDMYPGQGLAATSLMTAGQTIVNDYVLRVPPTAIAPAELELLVGLYDFETGERLVTVTGDDTVRLAELPLEPAEGPWPNPVAIRFENGIDLVGFALQPRRLAPGELTLLTTYWRANAPLADDYTFFAQIVDEDTTRYGANDSLPPTPTSAWQPGEVVELTMPLDLSAGTPPGAYPLIVGLYTRAADGGFDRLQLLTDDGRLTDDYLPLTLIRVDEP